MERGIIKFEGIIKTYQLPHDCDEQAWLNLPCQARNEFQCHETSNILTILGRQNIALYLSATSPTVPPFAQWMAFGTFPINTVLPGDTSISTEVLRVQPTAVTIAGKQVTIESIISTSQINNTHLTNIGIFGNNATSTPGSGDLQTKALYDLLKATNQAYAVDYNITLT